MGPTTYEGSAVQQDIVRLARDAAGSEFDALNPAPEVPAGFGGSSDAPESRETVASGHPSSTAPTRPPSPRQIPLVMSEPPTRLASPQSTQFGDSDDESPDTDQGGEQLTRQTEGGSTQRSGQDGGVGKKGL